MVKRHTTDSCQIQFSVNQLKGSNKKNYINFIIGRCNYPHIKLENARNTVNLSSI